MAVVFVRVDRADRSLGLLLPGAGIGVLGDGRGLRGAALRIMCGNPTARARSGLEPNYFEDK